MDTNLTLKLKRNIMAMKYFILSLFLICSLSSIAQKNATTRFGIRAGYSMSDIKGTEVELYQSQGGRLQKGSNVVVGATFQQHFISDRFLVQAELNYIVKGGKIKNSGFYETPNKTATYIQLPLMFAYDIVGGDFMSFAIEGGFSMNYAVKPIAFNKEYYTTPESIKTPKFLIAPLAGVALLLKGQTVEPYLNISYDFDNQKYFSRETSYMEYYIKHAGTLSLALGAMFKI